MTMPAVLLPPTDAPSHVSVMLTEVVSAIAPRNGGVYVDVTAGAGGHSEAVLQACDSCHLIALDRDPDAVAAVRRRLARFGERAVVVHSDFGSIAEVLRTQHVDKVDGVIADLGVSSGQLDLGARGMSFRLEGPLDMRMDPTRGETALELIARLTQDELADVIFQLGEERRSRRVARCIKQALQSGELSTTTDLRRAVIRAVGPRRVGGIDPSTRTFQALRIAVNRELEELEGLLAALPEVIALGGTAAVISFHSLEDRLVKYSFKDSQIWRRRTKKPLVATAEEQERNPRSRSAKLRVVERIEGPSLFLAEVE
jgi:16S rRNA (cytosine1402-N4)-methyltransferase